MGFRFIKNKKEEEELINRGKQLSEQYERNRQQAQQQAQEQLKDYHFINNPNSWDEVLRATRHNYGENSQEFQNTLGRYYMQRYGTTNPTLKDRVKGEANQLMKNYTEAWTHPINFVKRTFGNREAQEIYDQRNESTWNKIQQQTEQFNNIANEWKQSGTVGEAYDNTKRLLNVGLGIAKNYAGAENNTGIPLSQNTIDLLNKQKPIFDEQGMVANYRDKNINLPQQINTSQNIQLPTKNLQEKRLEENEKDSVAQELIKKADINKSEEQLEGTELKSLARANELSEMMDNGQTASALLQRFQEDVTGAGGRTIKGVVSVVPMVAEGIARLTGDEQAVQDLIDLRNDINRDRFNTAEIRSNLKSVREAQGKGGIGNDLLYMGSNVVDNMTGQLTAGALAGGSFVTNPANNYTTAIMSVGAMGNAFNEREQKQGYSNKAYAQNLVASTLEGIWNGVLEEATGGTFATERTVTDSAGKTVVRNEGWLDKLLFNKLAKKGIVNTNNMALVNGIWKYAGEVVEEVGTDLFTAVTNQIAGEKFSDNFNLSKEKDTITYTLITTMIMNALGMGGLNTEEFAKQYDITEADVKKLQDITNAVLSDNGLSQEEAKTKVTEKLKEHGIDVNNIDKTIENVNESENYKTALSTISNKINLSEDTKQLIRDIATTDGIITKSDYDNVINKINTLVQQDVQNQQAQIMQNASVDYDNLEAQKNALDELTPEKFNNQESRQFYAKQMNKPLTYNVDTILDAYPENRNGKRTVRQWKDMSKQIGTQMATDGLSIDEVRANAVGLWQQLEPSKNITRYDNQEHKNKGFDKLNNEIWTKGIYDSYKENMKAQIQAQQDNMYEQINNQMLDLQDNANILINTIKDYKVDTSELNKSQIKESLVESAERYGFKGKTLNEIQALMEKRGISSRFDDTKFNDSRVGSFYNPDNNEIVFNPNASEEQIIQELAVHEWYHELKQNNTEEATKIQEDIINYLKRNNQYADIRKNLEKTYIEQGYDKNRPDFTDMIDEEATAKALQQVLGNEEEIQRLNNYNRNLARRIYDAVVNLLNKFTGGRNEKLFWTNVRNNFERVFNTPGTANENNQSNNQKRLSTSLQNNIETTNNDQSWETIQDGDKSYQRKLVKSFEDNEGNIFKIYTLTNNHNELTINGKSYRGSRGDILNEIKKYWKGQGTFTEINTNNADTKFSKLTKEQKTNNNATYKDSLSDFIVSDTNSEISNLNSDFFKEKLTDFDKRQGISADGNTKVLRLKKGNNEAKVTLTENDDKIWIDEIYIKNKKQGYGTEIINAIKKYAYENEKEIETYKEVGSAEKFWDKMFGEDTKRDFSHKYIKHKPEYFEKQISSIQERIDRLTKFQQEHIDKEKMPNEYNLYQEMLDNDRKQLEKVKLELKNAKNINETATNLPEVKEGYTRLYRGLKSEYNNNYDKSKLDNVNGYESWTDDYDLAKAYGDNVYYIDVPTSEIKNSILDEDSNSETYGDRNLIYKNDKPVGIKGKNGNEYMLYTDHDNYKDIQYNKVNQTPTTDNQGRELSKGQQEYFKDSKARDENGNLITFYHKTGSKFNTVDFSKNAQGLFWFTDSKQALENGEVSANGVRPGQDVDIKEFYVEMKNPASWEEYDKYTIEQLKEKGYDGVLLEDDGVTTGFIFDNPNQIKNVDNTNPTSNPDIRYSVNTSGEMQDNNGNKVTLEGETGSSDKNLLAIHNLNAEKLQGVLELGGFPVPSIAITNPDKVNHNEFGDISVIFNKETINPKKKSNEVYDRDVWSPTFPATEYEPNLDIIKNISNNLGLNKSYTELDSMQSRARNEFYPDNVANDLNRYGYDEYINAIKNNKYIRYAYLKSQGLIEPVLKQTQFNNKVPNEALQEFLDKYSSMTEFSKNTPLNELSYEQTIQLSNDIKKIVKPYLEKMYSEYGEDGKKIIDKELAKYNDFSDLNKFIYSANSMLKNGIDLKEVDENATLDKALELNKQEEYEKWVDKNFDKSIIKNKGFYNGKEIYTPQGNRRSFKATHDEFNLENLVKQLKRGSTKGGQEVSVFGTGFGRISAQTSNRFNSIKEIKENQNRLMTREEATEIIQPISNDLFEKVDDLANYYKRKDYGSDLVNHMQGVDTTSEIIEEFAGGNLTEERLKKLLSEQYDLYDVNKIPSSLLNNIIDDLKQIKNLPTDYFEAKPQRAVTFDEIDTVVLPSDTSAELKQQLTDRGINYIEYNRENENEKADIIKSLDQYKFSKKSQDFDSWIKENLPKLGNKKTKLSDLKVPTKKQANLPTQKLSADTTSEILPEEKGTFKGNQKQRKAYKSIIESEFTSKEAKQIAYDYLNSDTYVPDSNKEQLERADKRIERNGIENELASLETNVNEGKKITADDIAVGDRLIKYYMTTGDKANLERSIRAMAMAGTQAGRTVQAFAMIRHQSPEGMAIWIQNSVDKLNSNLKGKQQFEFTPEMQEKILNSNSENLQQNVDEVMKELGQQVPVDFLGKLDAWRYFSMLGNPKTHIRNIVGNFAMAQTQKVKSKIAGTIEQVTGQDRTHTSLFERRNRKAIEFAKQDFQNADVKALLGIGTSKYTNPKNMIQQNQRTFKSDLLEKTLGRLFNINDNLLEAEDNFGLKNAYIRNLSDYMTANKLTAENMTGEQLQQARKMAVEESLRATFHQASALATTLNQIEQKNLFSRVAMGGLVPFKKTPINVAKTGFTYSPVGLAKTILSDTVKLRQGKINVNEYIDNLSQGLTGTGIALLGYGLAEAGILKAGGDDDKEDKYKQAMGDQPYAITINGNSYSLDWLAPSGIPLFVGAELNKLVKDRAKQGEEEANTINELERVSRLFDASATLLNPMSEMSMISGLTSTLQTFATDPGQGLMNLGINPIKSYVSQMAPTSLGQVARSTDEYERDTSSTAKGMIAKAVDSTKNQVMNKIPGLRQKLPTKKDIWGEEVKTQDYFHNAVLPYTKKEVKTNAVDKELNALYEKTGENIYPTTSLNKDVTYEGSKTRLTNKDYNEFKEAYGKNSYRILNSLVNSSEYKGMTDEQKVKAIKDVYTYANDLNKTNYAQKKGISFETPKDVQQVNAVKQNGGSEADYFKYKGMEQGLSEKSEKMTALKNSKLSTNSKKAIYESIISKDDDFYQSTDNLLNINEYLNYKTAGLTSDKDENGKTIKNSLKNNKAEWINQNISGYENRLLLMAEDYKLSRAEQETLLNYINMQSNAEDLFNELDKNYTVKDGRVYYK